MNELALFAGAGGGILGGLLHGWRTVAAVEIEDYPRRVLLQRQADGILPRFPIWDDVRTFDGRPWRGKVDVVSGGFPCQDISSAGAGAGIKGKRSGLWFEMARIIGEIFPQYVFVENSPLLVSRGLDAVLSDLAAMGYHAKWGVVGALHAGAPHKRERIWIVANAGCRRCSGESKGKMEFKRGAETIGASDVADADCKRKLQPQGAVENVRGRVDNETGDTTGPRLSHRLQKEVEQPAENQKPKRPTWWTAEPDVVRVVHGVSSRMDKIRALGNAQVPSVAALAWEILGGPTQ